MINPYETLGLKPWASPDEIRTAYRALVKQVHPDHIQDPEARKLAQERMVAINLAYKEALRLSTPRATLRTTPSISGEEAVRLACGSFFGRRSVTQPGTRHRAGP